MRPLAAAARTGSPASARQQREGARSIVAGAAPWALLTMACDAAWAQGSAVDTWHARVGTSPTAAGAARPAVDGHDLSFGGAQRMTGATGLLAGATGATSICMMEPIGTSGVWWGYGDAYYDARRAVAGSAGALVATAGNGETGVASRTYVNVAITAGMHVFATRHDRTAAAGSELAIYQDGKQCAPVASLDNDTTGTYAAGQVLGIGAYPSGSIYVTARYRTLGIVAQALPAAEVRRLSLLVEAACG